MRAVRIEKLLRIKRLRLAEPFEVTLRVFQTIATLTLLRAPVTDHINAVAGSSLTRCAVMYTTKT
jgi:hypothetical protein